MKHSERLSRSEFHDTHVFVSLTVARYALGMWHADALRARFVCVLCCSMCIDSVPLTVHLDERLRPSYRTTSSCLSDRGTSATHVRLYARSRIQVCCGVHLHIVRHSLHCHGCMLHVYFLNAILKWYWWTCTPLAHRRAKKVSLHFSLMERQLTGLVGYNIRMDHTFCHRIAFSGYPLGLSAFVIFIFCC